MRRPGLYTQAVIFVLALGGSTALKAEETAIGLAPIIVTNKRASSGTIEASENVTVVTEGRIEEVPARNLSEVLGYVMGVDIQPRQGFGRATSISIHGSDSRQVRLMIDGIPLNTQSSGQANPVEFPIENIKSIEIIKSPASSVWGSGLGGVINIITKDTGTTPLPKGNLSSAFAEFKTQKESFDLSGKAHGLGYYFLSSYMESAGNKARDDVLEKKAFVKISYDLKELGSLVGSFGYSGADVNSGEFPDGSWQAQPYKDRYGRIGWEKKFADGGIRVDLKHLRKNIITESFVSVVDNDPAFRVETKDMLYQVSINSDHRFRNQDFLVCGGDFDYDMLKSSVYLPKAKHVKVFAPYANYTHKMGQWDITSGLRYDHNREFGEQVSPSGGIVYRFKDTDTLIRASVSRAFTAPPLLWKFNDNPALGVAANPDIEPERAVVYQAGFESKVNPLLWLKLSLYRSDVKDALSSAVNDAGMVFKQNFQKFRRQGVELDSRVKVLRGLYFSAGAAFNDVEDRSTKLIVRGQGIARQSFNTTIEYNSGFGLSIYLIGYYNRWNESPDAFPNDRKMLCDLKIRQEWKNIGLFLNTYNLTNSNYWADYFFPLPERYFEGGFNLKW